MPFKSKAQARYMFAKHPQIAKEWAEKTDSIKKLVERMKKKGRLGRLARKSKKS